MFNVNKRLLPQLYVHYAYTASAKNRQLNLNRNYLYENFIVKQHYTLVTAGGLILKRSLRYLFCVHDGLRELFHHKLSISSKYRIVFSSQQHSAKLYYFM